MKGKGMPQQITIKDVARDAEVHPSTVSRVLNPATRSMVSQDLIQKVLATAEDLGYRRNPLAAGLRTRQSHTVGVVIPDLRNPLFPPIVRGIERTLDEYGIISILADSANNPQSEITILENMLVRQIEGVILATAHRKDQVVQRCLDADIPVVLVNRSVDSGDVPSVVNDDEYGIRLAFTHLVSQGHRRIAHVAGPQDTSTGSTRRDAFLAAAAEAGLNDCATLTVNAESFTEQAGRSALSALLSAGEEFTAIVAGNDLLAMGCYDALKEAGLNCPDDVSVTGFNDMPFIDRLSPPLTTVRIPHNELGVCAAQMLLKRIRASTYQDDSELPAQVRLTPELMVRGSTRALKGGKASVKSRRSSCSARLAS